jgi:3-oxoadipate enol-lactonase
MLKPTRTIATWFELSGAAGAPVVMLSHCLGSSAVMWGPQLPALEPHFRVLRYDIRGHGGSQTPPGPYTLEALADDAVALLDALAIETVHFVGLSLGGMIGQMLALAHPERLSRLVLCSTSAEIPAAAQPVIQERIDTARREGLAALVEGTLARWFTPPFLKRNPPEVQAIRRQFLATPVEGYAACTEALRGLKTLERLQEIDRPTLVIVGEDDPGTPLAASQAIQARIPGAQLAVIPKMLHLNNIEAAERFNRHLLEFLSAR